MLSLVKLKNPTHLKKDRHGHGVDLAIGEMRFKTFELSDADWLLEQSGSVLVVEHKATGARYKIPFIDVEWALEEKRRPKEESDVNPTPAPDAAPPNGANGANASKSLHVGRLPVPTRKGAR